VFECVETVFWFVGEREREREREREKRKWGIFLRKGEKREAKQERGDDWL
jgi:hypothetical protein